MGEHAVLPVLAALEDVQAAVGVKVADRQGHGRPAGLVAAEGRVGRPLETPPADAQPDRGAHAGIALLHRGPAPAPDHLPGGLHSPHRVLGAIVVQVGEVQVVRHVGGGLARPLLVRTPLGAQGHLAHHGKVDARLLQELEAGTRPAQVEAAAVQAQIPEAVAVQVREDAVLGRYALEPHLGSDVGEQGRLRIGDRVRALCRERGEEEQPSRGARDSRGHGESSARGGHPERGHRRGAPMSWGAKGRRIRRERPPAGSSRGRSPAGRPAGSAPPFPRARRPRPPSSWPPRRSGRWWRRRSRS